MILEKEIQFSISIPIPSFARFLSSSAKVVQTELKVERSGDRSFLAESSSCGEYSARKPFTFQALYSEMQTATETNDRWKSNKQKNNSVQTGSELIARFVRCFKFLNWEGYFYG